MRWGMAAEAVASGMPKLRIEESAARRQAAVDRGEEVIVGVKYRPRGPGPIDILDVDKREVRDAQVARLERIRASRDARGSLAASIAALEAAARSGGNLLAAAVESRRGHGLRWRDLDRMETGVRAASAGGEDLAGVYGAAYEGDEGFAAIRRMSRPSPRRRGAGRGCWW